MDTINNKSIHLPNFLICGAPKAGTTSLYEYLAQHPEICMSNPKETDYFQHNYDKGIDWYASCFAHYQGEKVVGEASPGNMIHPLAPKRIKELIPNAKIIMILRDPIDRVFSQFLYSITRGECVPGSSFSRFIRNEADVWRNRVIELGMYEEQIKRYMEYFPQEQMKIYFYEELKNNTEWLVKDLYKFIDVDSIFKPRLDERYNVSTYPSYFYQMTYPLWKPFKNVIGDGVNKIILPIKNKLRNKMFKLEKPELSEKDSLYLKKIYEKPINQLEVLLNKDLSHWK